MEKKLENCQIRPHICTHHPELAQIFEAALDNVMNINTVPCDWGTYNRTGKLDSSCPWMIRAGACYEQPWTRDAVLNTWNCGNFTQPGIARNTLLAVCEQRQGHMVIQQDDQDWDRVIWIIGAWQHVLATGNRDFAKDALAAAEYEWQQAENNRFHTGYGLFTGGSFFNDGISGYPLDLYESADGPGFQGLHPKVRAAMSLSTNCISYGAYLCTAALAEFLGHPGDCFREKAKALKKRIQDNFLTQEGYAYLLYPDGRQCRMQEACGWIFAAMSGICDDPAALLKKMQRSPAGLTSICPDFEGVKTPARHNQLIWPFINGFFVQAAAQAGELELAYKEFDLLTKLYLGSGNHFFEIYDQEGRVEGGWQAGSHYDSCHDQTWSASLYIGAVLYGFLGLKITTKGIHFTPAVPKELEGLGIEGLQIREGRIALTTSGCGKRIQKICVNGKDAENFPIPFSGEWKIHLELA
ncbi:hypothetical protein IMSAGC019_01761 [Lachnospiraceae bacterium]|nr:hypothetical protein IMSAGC019_01761 [Lachnospiraceae bacterium]